MNSYHGLPLLVSLPADGAEVGFWSRMGGFVVLEGVVVDDFLEAELALQHQLLALVALLVHFQHFQMQEPNKL